MTIFLFILLALVFVALSFDLIPFLLDMFGRAKIGTLHGENWFAAACDVAVRWCTRGLPVVPKVAGRRLCIIDVIKKNYKSGTIQSWQLGSVLLCANEIEPQLAADAAMKLIDARTGEWLKSPDRVDYAFLAYSVLSNPNTDKEFVKPAMQQIADMLLKKFDEFGSVPYSTNPSHRYVDTVGLVCPFLVKYSLLYGEEKAMKAAISLIEEYEKYGLHSEFSVPVHCFDAKTKAPLGLYSWGRGCGWWAVGLAESFRVLNETDPDDHTQEKKIVLKNLLTFAKTITAYQQDNGSFDRNIFACSGADSSATAMIAYALAYAGKLGGFEQFTDSARKAMEYIYTVTRRNGVVDYSQGDTMGIGFYSGESIVLPATQGFALRIYLLLNK